MALIKCKECGNEVSSDAKSCPKCGAPTPKKTSLLTWVVAGVFGLIVFNVVLNSGTGTTSLSSSAAKSAPQVDRSPAKQAERKQFIEKLIAQGLIQKVDTAGGNLPKMFVRPAFNALDLDTKQSFASVVYAYHFDGSNISDSVVLRDSRSGKDIGNYNPNLGGLKLE
jgi:hypothetical protein